MTSDSPITPRRRQEHRVAICTPMRVRCASWPNDRTLFSGNLSLSGAFIVSAESVSLDEAVAIELHVPGQETIRVRGSVCRIAKAGEQQEGFAVVVKEGLAAGLQRYQEFVRRALEAGRIAPATDDVAELPSPSLAAIEDVISMSGGPSSPSGGGAVRPDDTTPPAPPAEPPSQPAIPPKAVATAFALRAVSRVAMAFDFGTSRSCVALVSQQRAQLVRMPGGEVDLPSAIGFVDGGCVLVGDEACRLLATDPSRALLAPKRLLGRRYADPALERHLASLTAPVSEAADGSISVHGLQQAYAVPQVCAPILYRLRQVAEAYLQGRRLGEVVLAVPAQHDAASVQALQETAKLAGLSVVDLIDEPTAAALPYQFASGLRGLVGIYDFGGASFDFSVVELGGGDCRVVASARDAWLGGHDLTQAVARGVSEAFWQSRKIRLEPQSVQWQRLYFAAERAKRELSIQGETVINLGDLAMTDDGPLGIRVPVTRVEFERLAAPAINRSLAICGDALRQAGLQAGQLAAVCLSGGTSHIPAVREAVARFFGKQPQAVIPPERVVATGAAMYAAKLRASSAAQREAPKPPAPTSVAAAPVEAAAPPPHGNMERERATRVPIEANVTFDSDHNFYVGFTQNISEGGVFVATHQPLAIGDQVDIRLTLPGSTEPILARCEVRWLRGQHEDIPTMVPGCGCKFVHLPETSRATIEQFCNRREPLFYDDD